MARGKGGRGKKLGGYPESYMFLVISIGYIKDWVIM